MKLLMTCAAALLFVTSTISCKKNTDDNTCTAGAGGNTEVVVFATVNGDTVINTEGNDTAYVKYGTTSYPGSSPASFDKAFAGEAGEDHIHLTNLHCGSYYILRTSYDTLRKRRFTGSTGISFTKTSGEIDTTLVLQ